MRILLNWREGPEDFSRRRRNGKGQDYCCQRTNRRWLLESLESVNGKTVYFDWQRSLLLVSCVGLVCRFIFFRSLLPENELEMASGQLLESLRAESVF